MAEGVSAELSSTIVHSRSKFPFYYSIIGRRLSTAVHSSSPEASLAGGVGDGVGVLGVRVGLGGFEGV